MSQAGKTLAVLAALTLVAGGLGLYAYFGVQKKDEAEAKHKATTEQLFPAGQSAKDAGAAQLVFTDITVKAKGETTVLARDGKGEWQLTSPVKTPADKLTVDALTSQLQTAKFKNLVEEKPDAAALAKYGLTEPRFSVTARAHLADDPSSQIEVTLHGGIENTFDGSVYIQREGDAAVYSAQGGVRWALDRSSYDLRTKEVLTFDEAKVKAIEVKSKANAYALERDPENNWKLTRPVAQAADPQVIASLFTALKSERALAFPPETPGMLGSSGITAPLLQATLKMDGGDVVRLAFGQSGDKTYVLRDDPSFRAFAEVNASAAAVLDKSPAELRDRSVLTFKREQVAKIELKLDDGRSLTLERTVAPDAGVTEEWQVTAPERGPAKRFKLGSILWALGALKASQVVDENPRSWEKFGIGPKSNTVLLSGADGKELARLTLGKAVPGRTNLIYARGSSPHLIELDTQRLGDLPGTLDEVLDRPAKDGGT
jgi:hypothetical protein